MLSFLPPLIINGADHAQGNNDPLPGLAACGGCGTVWVLLVIGLIVRRLNIKLRRRTAMYNWYTSRDFVFGLVKVIWAVAMLVYLSKISLYARKILKIIETKK